MLPLERKRALRRGDRSRPDTGKLEMNVTNGLRPAHPGEVLSEELKELGMTADAPANALDVPTDNVDTSLLTHQC